MVDQPSTSHKRQSTGSNRIFGDISEQQILEDIMMIARRHEEEEKREAERKRVADLARAERERTLTEKFRRNLEEQNPERQRAPYSIANMSGGLFGGQTIRPDPLISAHSSNVNEAPTLIFSSMPKLAPVRPPPQKQKPQEPS